MSVEHGPRQEKNTGVFALSKTAVDTAMQSIRENAVTAVTKEGIILHNQNVDLESHLLTLSEGLKNDSYKYITLTEGALYTHRILRVNAEQKGQKLPKISQQQLQAMQGDRVHRMRFGRSLQDDLIDGWERGKEQNALLSGAIAEMAEYRSDKNWFYAGAGQVIEVFQKHQEIEIFKRQFR